MKQIIISLLLSSIFAISTAAQEVWTLEQCIQHAQQNNNSLKQSQIAIRQAMLNQKAQRFSRLPTVNGNIEGALNFGRTIDPTTNNFINQQVGYNSFGVNASVNVFNGGRTKQLIQQSEYTIEANKAQAAAQVQNLSLDITLAYLNILLSQEQLTTAQKQLLQSEQQLGQIDKKIATGLIPEGDRLEVLSQMARNEQTIVAAQNTLEQNYLTLKNFLQVPLDFSLAIKVPKVTTIRSQVGKLPIANDLYKEALQHQPSIRAGELQLKSAALNTQIAKANLLPRIDIIGSLNSSYSNVSQFTDAPYFNQVNNNFGQNIGVRVAIPIYNNHTTKIAIERANLDIIEAEIQQTQTKQALQVQVQGALAAAKGAKSSLAAAQKAVVAAKASYENATLKYQLGVINTLEYTTTKTSLDTAELDLVRAKYDYLFRLKVIDFFKGKEALLN